MHDVYIVILQKWEVVAIASGLVLWGALVIGASIILYMSRDVRRGP